MGEIFPHKARPPPPIMVDISCIVANTLSNFETGKIRKKLSNFEASKISNYCCCTYTIGCFFLFVFYNNFFFFVCVCVSMLRGHNVREHVCVSLFLCSCVNVCILSALYFRPHNHSYSCNIHWKSLKAFFSFYCTAFSGLPVQ